ncbi:MAG: type VI secretion system tube protein Hcp [Phycisphaeraceae bacterium]|nr:type VI secretion system tube protein Hcp [Phycisphaerales bacterium]QOJ18266.1 MAG: type VI secretion system tube protein Hcp [Phycisphaeraceae bacterium]
MILLKLPKIIGDCNVPGYEKYITCSSCSWNIERELAESGKVGTKDINVGVAALPPISLAKSMDTASVDLMQNAIAGGALGTAELKFVSTAGVSGKVAVYLEFKLDNAIVASWSIDASDDDRPNESVTLWYHKIWMKYYTTTDGETYTAFGAKGWDRVKNQEWNSGS